MKRFTSINRLFKQVKTTTSKRADFLFICAVVLSFSSYGAENERPQAVSRRDILEARARKVLFPHDSPQSIAANTFIGDDYKNMIVWMLHDLEKYRDNFEELFGNKLMRIERHQKERQEDLVLLLAPLQRLLAKDPSDASVLKEIERIRKVHKPHAFVEGSGSNKTYVDTWAVPFFNTGTQTWAAAKAGVSHALAKFKSLDLSRNISIYEFTNLLALFSRPEFDDLRRYKLKMFPTNKDIERFGKERSDARVFGDRYPTDALIVSNEAVDLDHLSYLFGLKVHHLGIISHSHPGFLADGRIFTGPADFLEHDFAHAFFNLTPVIPGTADEWLLVHFEFVDRLDQQQNLKMKNMMRLVYFHFTHESGFKALLAANEGANANWENFANEANVIREQIRTRHYYDWVVTSGEYPEGYEPHFKEAFAEVSDFFKSQFLRIQQLEQERSSQQDCSGILQF